MLAIQKMGLDPFWIIFGLGILFSALSAIAKILRDQKRRRIMSAFAAHVGLDYAPIADYRMLRRFKSFRLFGVGKARKAMHLVFGQSDEEMMSIFDYQYAVGSEKSQTVYRQSVVAIESPSLELPRFFLTPRKFLQRKSNMFGLKSVEFKHHPGFASLQALFAADLKEAKQFFDDRLVHALESCPFCLEAANGKIVFYVPRKTMELAELESMMRQCFELFAKLRERHFANSR